MEHAKERPGTEHPVGATMDGLNAGPIDQAQSMKGYSKEQLELMFKVAIQNLAERERLIEALCNCILDLQRDSMR